jgi:hypothetical protein
MEHFEIQRYGTENANKEHLQRLASLISELNVKLAVAEAYAKEHNLAFSCDFGYGGRADFALHSLNGADWQGIEYDKSDIVLDEYGEEATHYWFTSTQGCM